MERLTASDWFTVVGGIISIFGFVASIWIWLRSSTRERELTGTLASVNDIAGSMLWEMHALPAEDVATRLRQAERALGLAVAIHALTSEYGDDSEPWRGTEFGVLIERGVIIPNSMLWNIEGSDDTKVIWLVSPDLEPDLSDEVMGKFVNQNIRRGKAYVYFYPRDLLGADNSRSKLLANIGVLKNSRLSSRVHFVPIDAVRHRDVFQRGNSILFFKGLPSEVTPHAYEEVVLTQVSRRGVFWQQHDVEVAKKIHGILTLEYQATRPTMP